MIADEYRNAMAAIKWGAEYFIKCHTSEYEFYGQVGETEKLNEYWGRPEDLPEVYDTRSFKCTTKKPCSDLLAETSAALAAANVLFRGFDDIFAKKCLRHAIGTRAQLINILFIVNLNQKMRDNMIRLGYAS